MAGEEHDPLAIYVSNINWETTACVCAPRSSFPCGCDVVSDCCVLCRIRLREVFTQSFGRVAHVNLKENKVRRGPSYAFIIFESSDSAQKAIAQGSMLVDGRSLKFEARR